MFFQPVKIAEVASTGGLILHAKGSHEWPTAFARRAVTAGVGFDALDYPKPRAAPLASAARLQVHTC